MQHIFEYTSHSSDAAMQFFIMLVISERQSGAEALAAQRGISW